MAQNRLESAYYSVDTDIDIHYWEKGEGAPLLFIPGLTYSGEVFNEQINYFSDRYRVIAIDPRGQGLSTKTVHGNNYVTHGKDLAMFIEGLQLEKPVLIGWSTGNLAIWSYLEQVGYADIRGAVTIDMSPVPLSADPEWWTEGSIEELSVIASRMLVSPDDASDFWHEYLTEVMIQHKMDADEYEYLIDMSRRTPYWIAHELFCNAIFSNYLEVAQTAAKKIPTLMYIAEHWADIAEPFCNRQFPETPIYVLGGHLMAYEYPEQFNSRLDDFLNELDHWHTQL